MAGAQTIDWPTLEFTKAVTNIFLYPVGITHAGDGSQRLFVIEQQGRVWIVQNNIVLAQPFLNIADRASTGVEQGLLGLAFPPGFSTNRYFYVDYTRQGSGAIVISRFFLTATNSNLADETSEQTVVVIPKTYNNHNAGQLAFGPDGYLYIGVGDGGSEGDPLNNGQNTANFYGKILRIDVESGASPYAIPTSNPYVSSNNYAPEIWAYGLRNPWRFSFDDQTGDLYIGDVGQNNYEEIDFQPAGSSGGQNYGWRIMEGNSNYDVPPGFTNFSALTLPVIVYPHTLVPTDMSAAVIGGYAYRGLSQPRMDGTYFFGDFEAGWIWGLKRNGTNWQSQALFSPSFSPTNFMISTFGEDDQHDLYLADYSHGIIYQIHDSLATWTPTFSPAGGVMYSNTVTVTSLTTNALIYYTTNGLNPTFSDPEVASGGTITVATGMTNKLWAYRPGLAPSGVATAVFTLQVATPAFSPASGPITNGTIVSISTVTPGAIIYYTLDGTTPTTASPIYSGPFPINSGTTMKAFAAETTFASSSVQSTYYQMFQTATPVFNPTNGPVAQGTPISISCATPDNTIYYTLDGSTPTTNSLAYSNPVIVTQDTNLSAIAVSPGYLDSAMQSIYYTLIQAAAPSFNPDYGALKSASFITICTTTSNAIIRYTTDGSDPNMSSTAFIYSGPLTITNPISLTARAYRSDLDPSSASLALYGLLDFESTVVTTVAGNPTAGFQNGPGNVARFSNPEAICIDTTGDLYVADTGNHVIREISPAGNVTTYTNTSGQFPTPAGICVDPSGNIYVADDYNYKVSRVTPNGTITTLASISPVEKIASDSAGDIYAGTRASVDKIFPNGNVIQVAGTRIDSDFNWGPYVGVGIDAATNIYATTDNHIWITYPNGDTELFAGNNQAGFSDGPASLALFTNPQDAAIDSSTNVFITESARVRKIRFDGRVSTMAGTGTNGYQDGRGFIAEFNGADGLCVDTNENIYIADYGNNCIREISPDTYGIGIPDWWQLKYFGRVGIDPDSDPNNNGLTAYEDFWAGLNPTNPASVFKVESATVSAGGTQISWDSVLYRNYAVQWSPDLVSWNTITNNIAGTGSIISYMDLTASAQTSQRFYRILVSF